MGGGQGRRAALATREEGVILRLYNRSCLAYMNHAEKVERLINPEGLEACPRIQYGYVEVGRSLYGGFRKVFWGSYEDERNVSIHLLKKLTYLRRSFRK